MTDFIGQISLKPTSNNKFQNPHNENVMDTVLLGVYKSFQQFSWKYFK